MTSIKKVNKFKTAADTVLDTLACTIETRIRSGNYDLDPQWFEHVRWTPCGCYLDPCSPYPFKVRTKSFRMEFRPDKNKDNFTPWLIVKASSMGADAGFGLYANRCFRKGDCFTIYVGKKAKKSNRDKSRRLDVYGHPIDIQPTYFGARPLYFGAHFANTPYFGIPDNMHNAYDRNVRAGRNANAKIVGLSIQCTQDIQRGEEIRLDYGHRSTECSSITKKVKAPFEFMTKHSKKV